MILPFANELVVGDTITGPGGHYFTIAEITADGKVNVKSTGGTRFTFEEWQQVERW